MKTYVSKADIDNDNVGSCYQSPFMKGSMLSEQYFDIYIIDDIS